MYKPKHFKIQEFVDPITYDKFGNKSLMFFDEKILIIADNLKEYFDTTITINNWFWNGERKWSGLRTNKSDYYSSYSQHSFGKAIDFQVKNIPTSEVRKTILKHQKKKCFEYITRMENNTPTWIHVDCANINTNEILLFNP